ncbi:hypothetical protein IFM89_039782 [Coptis chinensis]|uniref:Phospholipid/glycerol acyltransferase domain-containing protein n=1 Tax=Coptis chinensis TaxID=261450 RepID=A0A835L9H6_9MAGN|nr:hypothetical protein IFM89_039782 [Coptis chinensis]
MFAYEIQETVHFFPFINIIYRTTAEYNSGVLVASGSIAQEAKDREIVARKLREHVQGADNNPLLIFPEGTCVNNHYIVTFKKISIHLCFRF